MSNYKQNAVILHVNTTLAHHKHIVLHVLFTRNCLKNNSELGMVVGDHSVTRISNQKSKLMLEFMDMQIHKQTYCMLNEIISLVD